MKIKMLGLILILVLVLAAGCGEERPADEAEYTFNLAHFFPAGHAAETELVQGWITALEEASDGRVAVTSYPGETLVKAADIYDGVVTGTADIGLSAFFYNRGRFPILEVFELPGIIYENSAAASRVAWEGIRTLDPEEVQDTELMFVLATGPGDLFTTSPVRTLEDLQGMRIRAAGLSAESLTLLGAVPDAMPQPEAYEALQRGLVQGNLAPVEVLKGWNHGEVTDYLTLTPFLYNAVFFVTMNQEKWDALPEDLQQVFLSVNESFFEEIAAGLWDVQNEGALQWAVEETGQEVIELDPDEAVRWIELVEPIQLDFIERMNALGHDGREIVETVRALAEQQR